MEQQQWRATVVKKSRGLLDGANLYRRVHIRLPDGSTRKIRVSRALWEALEVGDSLTKRAGADPVKD